MKYKLTIFARHMTLLTIETDDGDLFEQLSDVVANDRAGWSSDVQARLMIDGKETIGSIGSVL